jgi:hypothetical protein
MAGHERIELSPSALEANVSPRDDLWLQGVESNHRPRINSTLLDLPATPDYFFSIDFIFSDIADTASNLAELSKRAYRIVVVEL